MSSLIFGPVQTDGQTESDAYEPIMLSAQVGSKSGILFILGRGLYPDILPKIPCVYTCTSTQHRKG